MPRKETNGIPIETHKAYEEVNVANDQEYANAPIDNLAR